MNTDFVQCVLSYMQVYRSLLGSMFIGHGSIRGMSETTLQGTDLRLTTADLIQCTVCEYGLQKSNRFIDVIHLTFILTRSGQKPRS